jgi:hypothetical protein
MSAAAARGEAEIAFGISTKTTVSPYRLVMTHRLHFVLVVGLSSCAEPQEPECELLETVCDGTRVLVCATASEDGEVRNEFVEDIDCANDSSGRTTCDVVDGEASCVAPQ